MDPFTQRMLERARARQEKIDQKLVSSGQTPRRKPLAENNLKHESPVKSPKTSSVASPRKSSLKTASPKRTSSVGQKESPRRTPSLVTHKTPNKPDVVVKRETKAKRASQAKRNSDVSVEINIVHRDDIQIEVQVEEREVPVNVIEYEPNTAAEENDASSQSSVDDDTRDRGGLRTNIKSRLDRLGILYSDKADLSSPIHRTEAQFSEDTPPRAPAPSAPSAPAAAAAAPRDRRKFGRLAALADEINNWQDDLGHRGSSHEQKTDKPTGKAAGKSANKLDNNASTLDVSIHSLNDINKALKKGKPKQAPKPVNSGTYTKTGGLQRLDQKVVAALEREGYRRVSAGQSRLVFDFTTTHAVREQETASPVGDMATLVSQPHPPLAKKPSIKKYRAPTPPTTQTDAKDKENAREPDGNLCAKTEERCSPVVKRAGNPDRGSVLSRAAMFEAGSPKLRDPAEMSLRERKALFEKNKGAAIVPKAPFGQAPSAKALHGDNRADKPVNPVTVSKQTSVSSSKETLHDDNVSQTSMGEGIKDKLAALFNKDQTISETTISNKFRQERDKEMEMLQNRYHYKPKPTTAESDDDAEASEQAPLMGGAPGAAARRPEVVAHTPKVQQRADNEEVVASQPPKRRSSQDSQAVLSVLEDVKRIKVAKKDQTPSLYPHLSDLETDQSHTQESDCGGSSEDNINDKLNKSDNWAETSFGREVMNVVKKNNSSYRKATRDSDSSALDSELDDLLDDMQDVGDDGDSEGPTPPKIKHTNVLPSKSFTFEKGSPRQQQFNSPLKTAPADRGNELVHSVSFYRRTQNAGSSTPHRSVRHESPPPAARAAPAADAAVTVRRRIQDLQAEIGKQQTIISQASQALNLCASTVEFSGSTEQAEGERLLLLATHRRQACLHEVQRLRVEGAGAAGARGAVELRLSGAALALRRDYVRQLSADGAVGHHVLLLVKCRDRVVGTALQTTAAGRAALAFADLVALDGLHEDFKVTIEVYLMPASKEILSHEKKYHITSKKSGSKLLTPKSKLPTALKTPRVESPGGPHAVRTPALAPHGYCIFSLAQADRSSFTLSKVPSGSPLEGTLSLRIAARLTLPPPPPHAAFLTAFDDVTGLGAWHRRWFHLAAPRLAYWKYPDDVAKKMPIGDINLEEVISEQVVKCPRDLCARPNTLLLETAVPAGLEVPDQGSLVYRAAADGGVVRRHLLAADTPRDRDQWLEALNRALAYVRCAHTE